MASYTASKGSPGRIRVSSHRDLFPALYAPRYRFRPPCGHIAGGRPVYRWDALCGQTAVHHYECVVCGPNVAGSLLPIVGA